MRSAAKRRKNLAQGFNPGFGVFVRCALTRRFAFGVRRLAFGVWRSAFGVRRSAFVLVLVLVLELCCLQKRRVKNLKRLPGIAPRDREVGEAVGAPDLVRAVITKPLASVKPRPSGATFRAHSL